MVSIKLKHFFSYYSN